ncbi:glycosyltransferase family 4 protein [Halobacterium hubeiense]|uniref:glycosyltransferase family 4 protein n=1 Tax=Halobacterium hubeiense TaxID=1407499 RepID=UPI00211ACA9A|nr:glycosyltransferase family 4 protein [Halobacterium hubeiense]
MITREFPPHILGGISYHLRELYTRIVERGHDVTIVAGRCGDATYTPEESASINFDVHWADYRTIRAHHLQFPFAAKRALANIDLDQFDVAITHTELPFSLDVPTVSKYHDCTQEERQYSRDQMALPVRLLDSALNPTRKLVDKLSLRSSDRLIFNSKLTHDAWTNHYRVETDYDVIYNGVDTEVFYPRETGSNEDFLLFVGDSERKGLSRVLHSASQLDRPVYVIGPSNIDIDGVIALGRVSQSELARYYSQATATIHPAKFEAFGNVILESLACGTPVVVSDRCGAAEIIDNSCGAITADLSHGVDEVQDIDPGACIDIAEQYTWDNVARSTLDVLRDVRAT